jgi:hypothetical protein
MNESDNKPSNVTLALVRALKRGRDPRNTSPRASIDDICKAIGAVRTDLGSNKQRPRVTLFLG